MNFDVIILGAGAAGLFAAIAAGQRGRRVLLLDHAEAPGKKILISGGGRCNFTNTECVPERFLSANPHFARSALARYTICDPYLFTIGTWLEGDGVDVAKLPKVMAHRAAMLARPAVQKAVAVEGTQIG